MAEINTSIQLRHDTTENWETNKSKVLKDGEAGIEIQESGKVAIKIGHDGKTWEELDYFASANPAAVYQVELAEKLQVSDKAVSKWEKDDAFPYLIPNSSLSIRAVKSYSGVFLEDGSDKDASEFSSDERMHAIIDSLQNTQLDKYVHQSKNELAFTDKLNPVAIDNADSLGIQSS